MMSRASREITLDDLLYWIERLDQEGEWKEVLQSIPGRETYLLDLEGHERDRRRNQAIIQSMTSAERADGSLLNPSRILRVAQGSGTTPNEVIQIVSEFYQMRIEMRKYKDLRWFQRPKV